MLTSAIESGTIRREVAGTIHSFCTKHAEVAEDFVVHRIEVGFHFIPPSPLRRQEGLETWGAGRVKSQSPTRRTERSVMTTTTAQATDSKVSLGAKISFPFSELASQFTWTVVSSYLLLFYTDVAMIAPAAAGSIMLIARILDGIQDLGFGYIAERTQTKWRRFRTYIMLCAPFLTLALVMTFWSPNASAGVKWWYALLTYILLCFIYTIVNMSYGALAGVMTTDSNERLNLNWLRGIGGGVAASSSAQSSCPCSCTFQEWATEQRSMAVAISSRR